MYFSKIFIFIYFLLVQQNLAAQNYQAIHGSSYAGSLGSANNPASIVHVPYSWDITPFAVQVKHSTNALAMQNYSLLSSPNNITVAGINGTRKRFVAANQNMRLLNTRVSLNSKTAVAFGANIRSHIYASTAKANWQDTMYSLADFLKINTGNLPLSASFSGSTWAEFYASYAQTIIDDGFSLLNMGVTLKLNRSIAGGYAFTSGINYTSSFVAGAQAFELNAGSLQYGYSSNFDKIDSNRSAAANRKIFLQNSSYNAGADIGFEYIKLTDEDREEGGDYAYETKIGLSVMDIGYNRYVHGARSRLAVAGKAGITDTLLEDRFSGVENMDDFNDSLASIARSLSEINGNFFIYQPTRIVINIDQHLLHNFFVNAELSLPLASLATKNSLFIKDINLLAITPRWELKSMGAYLPISYNNRNQLWVGAAFKAGPLLMGTHNLANVFTKNSVQSGGIYMAVTVRPSKLYDRKAHYPREKVSKKNRKYLECPSF